MIQIYFVKEMEKFGVKKSLKWLEFENLRREVIFPKNKFSF